MARRSPRLAVIISAFLALLGPLLVQLPAQAAAPSYVALGDSYASGTGTRSYIPDGSTCQRSTLAYPSLIAAAQGYALNFRACSGARISDVTNTQLSALSPATNYVTVSVGGNDAGFAGVLTECAKPGWLSNCGAQINAAQAFITTTLPGQLDALYAGIRTRAPGAKVVVVGYPRIFNGVDCNAFTWFSPSEQARLNQTADLLNARTAAVAGARGLSFADPTGPFIGHAVCAADEWINGLSSPISESFHPKANGHASGYTPTVSPVLVGAVVAVTQEVVSASASTSEAQAELQSQYAAGDRAITPEEFVAPDLTTPAARKAARRAGIDIEEFIER